MMEDDKGRRRNVEMAEEGGGLWGVVGAVRNCWGRWGIMGTAGTGRAMSHDAIL